MNVGEIKLHKSGGWDFDCDTGNDLPIHSSFIYFFFSLTFQPALIASFIVSNTNQFGSSFSPTSLCTAVFFFFLPFFLFFFFGGNIEMLSNSMEYKSLNFELSNKVKLKCLESVRNVTEKWQWILWLDNKQVQIVCNIEEFFLYHKQFNFYL